MAAPQDQVFLDQLLEIMGSRRDATRRMRVADVGSFDVNGNPRRWAEAQLGPYTGFDARPGPNVDVVADVCLGLPAPWDVILCLNTLEHVAAPWVAVGSMARVLAPGGHLLLVAPEVWPEHDHPVDLWRFLPQGLAELCRFAGLEVLWQDRVTYGGPGEVNAGVIAWRAIST